METETHSPPRAWQNNPNNWLVSCSHCERIISTPSLDKLRNASSATLTESSSREIWLTWHARVEFILILSHFTFSTMMIGFHSRTGKGCCQAAFTSVCKIIVHTSAATYIDPVSRVTLTVCCSRGGELIRIDDSTWIGLEYFLSGQVKGEHLPFKYKMFPEQCSMYLPTFDIWITKM